MSLRGYKTYKIGILCYFNSTLVLRLSVSIKLEVLNDSDMFFVCTRLQEGRLVCNLENTFEEF